jgi:hypothetical protein
MISLRSVVEIYNEHHVGIFLIKFLSRGFRFELDDPNNGYCRTPIISNLFSVLKFILYCVFCLIPFEVSRMARNLFCNGLFDQKWP